MKKRAPRKAAPIAEKVASAAPPPNVILSQLPGFRERAAEVRREITQARESAFLDLPHKLCGVECHQLKLTHWQALAAVGNPFALGGTVTLHAVAQFVWVLSLQRAAMLACNATDEELAEAGAAFVAGEGFSEDEFADLLAEVSAYFDEAFADMAKGSGDGVPSACLSVHIWREIHKDFPRELAEEILAKPLAAIFQFLRLASDDKYLAAGRTPPSWSRLDRLREEFAFGK